MRTGPPRILKTSPDTPCPLDTDGDGNCHLCFRRFGGCIAINGVVEFPTNVPLPKGNPVPYIADALRTESPVTPELVERLTGIPRDIHALMGLVTETGELVDAFKRFIFYGKPVDEVNIKEEIGDLFWYLAILCDAHRLGFESVMAANIEKLRARYPQKFDEEKALFRDLDEERQVLETGRDPDTADSEDCGDVGYEAYREFTGGVSLVTQQPIPTWNALPAKIRAAWDAAAAAIRQRVEDDIQQQNLSQRCGQDNGTPPDLR